MGGLRASSVSLLRGCEVAPPARTLQCASLCPKQASLFSSKRSMETVATPTGPSPTRL